LGLVKDLYALASEDAIDVARTRTLRMGPLIDRCVRRVDDSPGQERVVVSLASELPQLAWADAEKLVRVLSNLLENALAASPPSVPVWLCATEQDGEICIEVEDRGPGMRPEIAARAFDLYFTTRRAEGGTGIGLSLAREMVEDLGGTLELASEPGHGTRAILRLPRSKPKGDENGE